MGIAEIIALLPAFLKFWDSIIWLVKMLKDTPEEKREKIMISLRKESDQFKATGRPTWG